MHSGKEKTKKHHGSSLTQDFSVFQIETNKENKDIKEHTRAQECLRPKNVCLSRHYHIYLINSNLVPIKHHPTHQGDVVNLNSVGLYSSCSLYISEPVTVL